MYKPASRIVARLSQAGLSKSEHEVWAYVVPLTRSQKPKESFILLLLQTACWQEGYILCCGNLYYGCFLIQQLCLFIIINLKAFDVALISFLYVVFQLISLK